MGEVFVMLGQKWTEMTLMSPADLEEDAYLVHSEGFGARRCPFSSTFSRKWSEWDQSSA